MAHDYPTLSLHPQFKPRGSAEKLCWTHVSIFYDLPYWESIFHPYSLDVMHIEKNVFDNIKGTILGLEGKTKDDVKARKGLEKQGVRRKLWFKPTGSKKEKVSKAPYTVTPNEKVEILELMKDVKYPYGYAGSLRNKINLDDKKFIGLKTRDCHVMLQCLLPLEIVKILCQLERIFSPAFFTIMVHLMVHLPDQILLKGLVHYSWIWMYPMERQLRQYRNM
ncbi:unnamed protein product [Rhodiola kirilowii]